MYMYFVKFGVAPTQDAGEQNLQLAGGSTSGLRCVIALSIIVPMSLIVHNIMY